MPRRWPGRSAQAPAADSHTAHHPAANEQQADLSEGEVTRVDAAALEVGEPRHGELKNLDIPAHDDGVFRVQDAAQLVPLKAGDKVRFRAEQDQGAPTTPRASKRPSEWPQWAEADKWEATGHHNRAP